MARAVNRERTRANPFAHGGASIRSRNEAAAAACAEFPGERAFEGLEAEIGSRRARSVEEEAQRQRDARERARETEVRAILRDVERLSGRKKFAEALAKLDAAGRADPELLAAREKIETLQHAASGRKKIAEPVRTEPAVIEPSAPAAKRSRTPLFVGVAAAAVVVAGWGIWFATRPSAQPAIQSTAATVDVPAPPPETASPVAPSPSAAKNHENPHRAADAYRTCARSFEGAAAEVAPGIFSLPAPCGGAFGAGIAIPATACPSTRLTAACADEGSTYASRTGASAAHDSPLKPFPRPSQTILLRRLLRSRRRPRPSPRSLHRFRLPPVQQTPPPSGLSLGRSRLRMHRKISKR